MLTRVDDEVCSAIKDRILTWESKSQEYHDMLIKAEEDVTNLRREIKEADKKAESLNQTLSVYKALRET